MLPALPQAGGSSWVGWVSPELMMLVTGMTSPLQAASPGTQIIALTRKPGLIPDLAGV